MLTAKINVGALKAAALAASKELSRHYLNGVLIEVSPRAVVYVATDGQMLFAYRDGLSERDPDNMLLGDFIVPVPVIKSIKLKKSASESASLRDSTNGDGELTIKTADGGSYGFAPIDGTFPNWRAVGAEGDQRRGRRRLQSQARRRLGHGREIVGCRASRHLLQRRASGVDGLPEERRFRRHHAAARRVRAFDRARVDRSPQAGADQAQGRCQASLTKA